MNKLTINAHWCLSKKRTLINIKQVFIFFIHWHSTHFNYTKLNLSHACPIPYTFISNICSLNYIFSFLRQYCILKVYWNYFPLLKFTVIFSYNWHFQLLKKINGSSAGNQYLNITTKRSCIQYQTSFIK